MRLLFTLARDSKNYLGEKKYIHVRIHFIPETRTANLMLRSLLANDLGQLYEMILFVLLIINISLSPVNSAVGL